MGWHPQPAGVLLRPVARSRSGSPRIDGQGIVAAGSDSGQPGDLTHALERIAALHSAGALTDEEFTVAKQRLLHDGAGPLLPNVAPQDDEDGDRDHGVEGR